MENKNPNQTNQVDENIAKEYFMTALNFSENGQFDEAEKYLLMSLELIPDRLSTLTNLALILIELNKLGEAEKVLQKILNIYPNDVSSHIILAKVYDKNANHVQAMRSYQKALGIDKNNVDALYGSAIAMYALGSLCEAVHYYEKVIGLDPLNIQVYNNLGIAYAKLQKHTEALSYFNKAIKINPKFSDSYFNSGLVFQELQIHEDAEEQYNKAIALNPSYAPAILNLGLIYQEQGKLLDALNSFQKVIDLNSNLIEAFYNKGNVLRELKRYREALECYKSAYDIDPNYNYLLGTFIYTKMHICEWGNLQRDINNIKEKIENSQKISPCLALQIIVDSAKLQLKNTLIWATDKYPSNHAIGLIPKAKQKQKIRIGYYSSDFREHPVSYLMAEHFEIYDKNKFEQYGFYFGPKSDDVFHRRISVSMDKFIDVSIKTDKQIAELSRELQIDIAVDLNGFTSGGRSGIFSYRAAPIQASYIGYLGTMGADYYDYLFADATLIPFELQIHYAEKIVYLASYQANDSKRTIAATKYLKSDLGLPENSFTFCCLNNNFKITPDAFDLWMKILQLVPGSSLFLLAENNYVRQNLCIEASNRGISKDRLYFGGRLDRGNYLARYAAFDLFLDTFPYNAGATGSDALWMGLPFLTLKGETFASRMGASLLSAIDMPELIVYSPKEYVEMAVKLATNLSYYLRIKEKLKNNKISTRLFDTKGFTSNIEAAFSEMQARYNSGLGPEHIVLFPT